jgi:two-component system OmpR family response regulator/two-component system copper resistance phosphate regulon response regulator CusR
LADILIIEDEVTLGKALSRGLSDAGHHCELTRNGAKGLELFRTQKFDACILDLMLPDMHGLDLLKQARDEGIQTPVLVLTALGSVDDRVTGLDAGADDYLVKPFAFPELLARIDAICRRSGGRPAMVLEAGPVSLHLGTRTVTREAKQIELSPTEFSILELLMRHAGHVVTRKMLSEHIWHNDWDGVTNVIEVHINRLRSKIDRGFDQSLIQTVRGRGYVLRAT